jgi:mannose-6-phosphate isomerase-like protein (cupin superfamily)
MNTTERNHLTEDATWRMAKNILNAGELNGSLTLLGPGSSTEEMESAVERVLYIAQGSVTATVGPANYMLNPDETLHIVPGRILTIRNHGDSPAKIFTLALPSRRREENPLMVLN